ncbi:MAG: hypothetical protein M3437_01880 [Chloroflexota bacterium]|nr:hypothetical protein [Chloroflexota bacterium]MDQ5866314.1 hypothetical protein [Chloroflexota bacterium]
MPTTLVTPSATVTSEAAPATPTYVLGSQEVYPTPEGWPTTESTPTYPPELHLPFQGKPNISPAEAREIIAGRATEVIQALKSRDMEGLARLAHPEAGVRFSPYPSVGNMDQGITPAELRNVFADDRVSIWGWYDGSGKPMEMTFSEYYDEFVYNQDFAATPSVTYNEFKGHGNTVNNIFAEYPDAITVEYHFPGFDPQYQGSDWESLYLVFQKYADGNWYLAHIAHGYWTI